MRSIISTLLLSSFTLMSHAQTIKAYIPKDNSFLATGFKMTKLSNGEPDDKYTFPYFYTNKFDGISDENRKFDSISFDLTMKKLSYDKSTEYYTYVLSVGQTARLFLKNEPVGTVNGKIYFANTHSSEMKIQGKINHKFVDMTMLDQVIPDAKPKINENDINDFILTISENKDLILSSQHTVSLIIDKNG